MRLMSAMLLGYVAGTRSMLGPAVASWATQLERPAEAASPVAFMQEPLTPLVLSTLATGEIVADKLPFMPSRKAPVAFFGRLVSGALAGAAVGAATRHKAACAALGLAGALTGTLAGAALRSRLSEVFGRDLPAALLEDALAFLLLGLALQQMQDDPVSGAA